MIEYLQERLKELEKQYEGGSSYNQAFLAGSIHEIKYAIKEYEHTHKWES